MPKKQEFSWFFAQFSWKKTDAKNPFLGLLMKTIYISASYLSSILENKLKSVSKYRFFLKLFLDS